MKKLAIILFIISTAIIMTGCNKQIVDLTTTILTDMQNFLMANVLKEKFLLGKTMMMAIKFKL